MTQSARIYEVSPRDGLQNESRIVATSDKIRLVDQLSACRFDRIEVASFVSPKLVPQMADGEAVLSGITRSPRTRYTALVPNTTGYTRARRAGADEIAVLVAASEGFSRANTNCTIDESLQRVAEVLDAAGADAIRVRGYISCAIACPYDGPTDPVTVARLALRLAELGCYEISLADTIGAGMPHTVAAMLDAVLAGVPPEHVAGHFHDTGGRALANIEVCLDRGLRVFDASVGGLGGCPFAPGAKGNVDTFEVVRLLHGRGLETGLDMTQLVAAVELARRLRRVDA
ncbi:MAG: hydroxymethylglutaryl-CoA lyase [Pseudomonadota bacterium]